MKIETKKDVSEKDWHYLTQWRERVFPEEGLGKEWYSVSWHTIAYSEQGDPIGHIGFDRFEVLIGSVRHLVVGIGGVVVRPQYQGQGIPASLFEEVYNQASKICGSEIFALFCPARLVPYYEKHGYCQHKAPVYFQQPSGQVLSSFDFMHRGGLAADGVVEIQSPPW